MRSGWCAGVGRAGGHGPESQTAAREQCVARRSVDWSLRCGQRQRFAAVDTTSCECYWLKTICRLAKV